MSGEPNEVQKEIRKMLSGLNAQLAESTNVRGYGSAHAELRKRLALIGPRVVWRKTIGPYTLTITRRSGA